MAHYVDCPDCQGWGGPDQSCPTCLGGGQILVDGSGSGSASSQGCIATLIGNLFLALVMAGLFVAIVAGVVIYQSVTSSGPGIADEAGSVTTWTGAYKCTSGEMQMVMVLDVAAGSNDEAREVEAEFWYGESAAGDAGGPADSTALGTLTGRELNLIGEDPAGAPPYQVQGLSGVFGPEADVVLATVVSGECDSVGLTPAD